MVQPGDYRKRNVWFLEMGPRESKIKSPHKTATGPDRGTRASPVTSSHRIPLKTMQLSSPEPVPVWPQNSVRWGSQYDVYICHSKEDADCSYAMEMLSYLEAQPEKLRCFLPMKDMLPGSPESSEMCNGIKSSHCWVMLLTSHFLSDDWCKYQMHQSLAQAPCSNGRLIPVMIGLAFAQYPAEMRHMYAYRTALNDKSVFDKIKGAIVTYLKDMITVTSDQIPAYSPSNMSLESSRSSRMAVDKNQEKRSQETTSDLSKRSSVTELETTSNMSLKSPVSQEITEDMSSKSPATPNTTSEVLFRTTMTSTSDMSIRSSVTGLETTSDMFSRAPMTEETTNEVPLRSLVADKTTGDLKSSSARPETTSDLSMIKSFTGLNTTSDVSPMAEKSNTEVSFKSYVRQENNSDMSMRSYMTRQETTTEVSFGSLTQVTTTDMTMKSSVTEQKATSETSSRSPVTTSNVSISSSMTEQGAATLSLPLINNIDSSVTEQETENDLSLSPPLINNRDICTDCKCIPTVTKDSFSRETPINTSDSGVWSMTMDLVTQDTTSDMSMTKQDTTSDVSIRSHTKETTGDMTMRSSVTKLDTISDTVSKSPVTTSDVSISSSVTEQETTNDLSLSPPLINNRDIGTDCKCVTTTTKDLFSREERINTSDSGVWSMTMDLVTQDTTSDMPMRNSMTRQDTTSDGSFRSHTKEITSDMTMRSSVTKLDTISDTILKCPVTTSDVSISSSVTEQETANDLSLPPPLTNNRDAGTDCKCIPTVTKDSFSRETRINTSDSGVWSMTMDLHTDCSDV